MEKIEEMNNIDNSTTQKEEIEKNEIDNEFINIQTENAENKEKFEIDASILSDKEELEKVMEAIIYVEGNVPMKSVNRIHQNH